MANCCISLILLLAGATQAATPAPPLAPFLLDEARELALVRSAAPPDIALGAGVFVLRTTGFERAKPSSNGFECLVLRGFNDQGPKTRAGGANPKVLGPICYGPEAVRTEMRLQIEKTALIAARRNVEEIRVEIAARLADGRIPLPARAAIAYMFSSGQWLGDGPGHFHPHVMLWVPYLDAAQVGPLGAAPMPQLQDPGAPYALLAIPIPQWIHPAPAGGGGW